MYLRERFPIFQSKTYINSCSYGALSTDVRAAFEKYLEDRNEYGARWEYWVEMLEELRHRIAVLLNVSADEMALTSSLSEGLNALASALSFDGQRNRIVVTDFDFPTTAQIWIAQEKRGATIVRVAADEAGQSIPLENFEKAIDESTLLVSIPYICYRNGARQELEPIIKLAHNYGAMVFVDCYQAVGAIPIDAKKLEVEFLAGGMHKYLLSTAGNGFLYVCKSLHETLQPTASGWFSQRDIDAMDISRNDPSPTARRFESGTPNVANIYAAIAGLTLLEQVKVSNVENCVRHLVTAITNRAMDSGFTLGIAGQAYSPMVSLKSKDMYALVAKLAAENIIISCRDNNLRISPHFYNNLDDIEHLFAELIKNRALMA